MTILYILVISMITSGHVGYASSVNDYDSLARCERARDYARNIWADDHAGQTTRYPQFTAECIPVLSYEEE